MLETEIYPDFIVVDGKEGGTGAAPLEFIDHLGMPMREGLNFVHNALIGINARNRIKLGAAGKIISAFDIARVMALGADWCNAARGFMFALGCIQSSPATPTAVRPGSRPRTRSRQRALIVADKSERVFNFHRATIESLAELVAAAGLEHPTEFRAGAFFTSRFTARSDEFLRALSVLAAWRIARQPSNKRFRVAWAMAHAADSARSRRWRCVLLDCKPVGLQSSVAGSVLLAGCRG